MDDLARIRAARRAMWGSGEFAWLAEMIWGAGGGLVRRLGVGPGDRLLDVGCGTGNVAVQAAEAGALVTGLDISPAMLVEARATAARHAVEVDWVEGDAERLPFAAGAFDVAASSFGCVFAPRHEVVAAEMTRVLGSDGRLGVLAWTVDGEISEFLGMVADHLPPPPALAAPPALWGDEGHVRAVFAGTGVELAIERDRVEFRFASPDEATAEYSTRFGPLLAARALLEPQGLWEDVVLDVADWFAHRATRHGVVVEGDYLRITGRVAG